MGKFCSIGVKNARFRFKFMCFKNVLCFGNIYNITIQKSIIPVYYGKPWQRNVVIKQLWLQIVSPSVVTMAKSLLMRNDFRRTLLLLAVDFDPLLS